MIKASSLRNKDEINSISSLPGYYKWWAAKSEFALILKALKVQLEDIQQAIETKDDLFCIYVGIAVKESVRARLNWHVNDKHTVSQVNTGTLSTLRQSISSIVSGNQFDKAATDSFIDKLYVEWFYSKNQVKSEEAMIELHEIEKNQMADFFCILNIQDNHHPFARTTKIELKRLRKESKACNKAKIS